MKNISFRTWILSIGLSIFLISLAALSLFSMNSRTEGFYTFFIEALNQYNDFHGLLLFGIFLIVVAMFLNIFEDSKKYKEIDLQDYLDNYHGRDEDLPIEEKERLLAELNFIISKIEENISTDSDNAWKWEIKLKSALFIRGNLKKAANLSPKELSEDDKAKLEKESSLLNLKEYNLQARTDPSTVSSIKEKMALYRKHRERA